MRRLESQVWDLLVVGGGITGVAVARDAALRGLRVALIEREDFAFGTSSRSSRLIHGGLRYLKNFDFSLVREGLVERKHLLDNAPGLVRPAPFLYPVYQGDPDPVWRVYLGVRLYQALSAGYGLGGTRHYGPRGLAQAIPSLRRDSLRGAVGYLDAATHDTRLTLSVAYSARRAGAELVARCGAVRLTESPVGGDAEGDPDVGGKGITGGIGGALVEDRVGERQFPLRAHATVLCCGPWQKLYARAKVKLRTARGSHLSLRCRRMPIDRFVALRSPRDGRLAFAMPLDRYVVLGTTDADDTRRPGEVRVTTEDTDYLLELANHAFPAADVERSDITGAWAGLRPLVADGSGDDADALSRRHTIAAGPAGLWILTGGKLTTHRRMAQDFLDQIEPFLKQKGLEPRACSTDREVLLPGTLDRGRVRLGELGLPKPEVGELAALYGARLEALADRITAINSATHSTNLTDLRGRVLAAQVELAIEEEWALSLDDVLMRRLAPGQLDLVSCWRRAPAVARRLAEQLGWDETQTLGEIDQYRTGIERDLTAAGAPAPGF